MADSLYDDTLPKIGITEDQPSLSDFGASKPVMPRSILGTDVAPGQQISDKQMPKAEKLASDPKAEAKFSAGQNYHNQLNDFGDQKAALQRSFADQHAVLDHLMPTNIKDPNYMRDLASYSAEKNRIKQNEAEFKEANPWGSAGNHPGFFGKLGHVLGTIGNVAGAALAPGIAEAIPGSKLNLERQAAEAQGGIDKAEGQYANLQKAEAAQTTAGAHQTEAGTNAAVKPIEAAVKQGELGIKDRGMTNKETSVPSQLSDAALHQITNNPDLSPEQKLEQLVKLSQDIKPKSAGNQDDQKYEDIIARKKQGQPISPEDAAWAGAYEKRKTLNPFASATAQAPQHATERSDRSYQTNINRTDKLRKPIDDTVTRLGRLQDTLNQHNPQADALVGPELLTVMAGGQGSGLRMNEAEISRIVGGRSQWENLKAAMQHWSTNPDDARSITADQDRQIRALVDTVYQKLTAKQRILDEAEDSLSDTDDPKQHRQVVDSARKKLDAIDLGQGGAEPTAPTGGGGRPSVAEWLQSQKKPGNP